MGRRRYSPVRVLEQFHHHQINSFSLESRDIDTAFHYQGRSVPLQG